MALTPMKFAVYYGTVVLVDGSVVAYTAPQIASFYNVADLPYLAVPLVGPDPPQFRDPETRMSYAPLKPQKDPNLYFDAKERYNYYELDYLDDDFDAHAGGKWAVRPRNPDPDAI